MITSSSTAILLDSIIKDKETKVLKSFGNHSQDPQTPKWQNQLFSMIPSRALIFISTPDLLVTQLSLVSLPAVGKGLLFYHANIIGLLNWKEENSF